MTNNSTIKIRCKYCTIPDVWIILKKVEERWIPYDIDQNGITATMHTHRHKDDSK